MTGPGQQIAGIDEVGRGCIAGPVIAAAVILDPDKPVAGLADSKQLSARRREALAAKIQTQALSWAIGRAEVSEIDHCNILQASLLAMTRAYTMLKVRPEWVLVDGKHYPEIDCPGDTIVQGDSLIAEISAASIIAKVFRDNEMLFLDHLYPDYGFARHKGYPTKLHCLQLEKLGVSQHHRLSFAPVKKRLTQS